MSWRVAVSLRCRYRASRTRGAGQLERFDGTEKDHGPARLVRVGRAVRNGAGKNLSVTDAKGNTAMVTIADVYQSNGVILVVDKVLMPN